jgi:hypothetical protein
MSSNPSPPAAPSDGPDLARQQQNLSDAFRLLWYSFPRRLAVPALLVVAAGVGLFLGGAATYRQAFWKGYESGVKVACVNDKSFNDSLRLVGARRAAFGLWKIGWRPGWTAPKPSHGFCFLKQEFSSYDSGWRSYSIYNIYAIDPDKEYMLDSDGLKNRARH